MFKNWKAVIFPILGKTKKKGVFLKMVSEKGETSLTNRGSFGQGSDVSDVFRTRFGQGSDMITVVILLIYS